MLAALDKLGFDITDDKIAEIKGDMTIRLLRPFDSLLKFVVELPDKEMIFDLDEHTQVKIIEAITPAIVTNRSTRISLHSLSNVRRRHLDP